MAVRNDTTSSDYCPIDTVAEIVDRTRASMKVDELRATHRDGFRFEGFRFEDGNE